MAVLEICRKEKNINLKKNETLDAIESNSESEFKNMTKSPYLKWLNPDVTVTSLIQDKM